MALEISMGKPSPETLIGVSPIFSRWRHRESLLETRNDQSESRLKLGQNTYDVISFWFRCPKQWQYEMEFFCQRGKSVRVMLLQSEIDGNVPNRPSRWGIHAWKSTGTPWPGGYLIFRQVPISSWGSRGFSILIFPSRTPVGNVPVDLWLRFPRTFPSSYRDR